MNPTRLTGIVVLCGIVAACSDRQGETTRVTPDPPDGREPVTDTAPSGVQSFTTETEVLGPFTGFDAPLHPDNREPAPIEYYGTDLGWTYAHGGEIHFLFGDTHKNELGEGITETRDDSFGTIAMAEWQDPSQIGPENIPRIRMGQVQGTTQVMAIDTGRPMRGLKTPNGAFSNGEREFGTFITGKPTACRSDQQCPAGLTCDQDLGYLGSRPDVEAGLTLACAENWPGCNADTLVDVNETSLPGSGLCVDHGSSMYADSEFGRVVTVVMELLVGIRSEENPAKYEDIHSWTTNRFINTAFRPVADFVPERGAGHGNQDYRNTPGPGPNQRVFLWGRPWFNGVNAKGQTLAMYVGYVDMPAGPGFEWNINYYTGSDANGRPQFSANETDAVPVDLDSTRPGVQPEEIHDFVQHMSVVWLEELGKWVMFYGGGISKAPNERFGLVRCGIAEIFARTECENTVIGNGALRMRTADDPWGPWSPPQDLIIGGNPDARPLEGEYAPGGVLYHPACEAEDCEARSLQFPANDYGWLYGANIIEEWNRPTDYGMDVIWLASTWDPYRVIMLRTRIRSDN